MQNELEQFFIIGLPGLEAIIAQELKSFLEHNQLGHLTFSEIPGGIQLNAPLKIGLELNQYLKTPTRILLRVDEFKCKDGPKLYNKISKIKWSQYITGKNFELEVSTHQSRLFDSRKIESAARDGINLFIDSNPLKKKYIEINAKAPPAKIYVRIVDDVCTISLDTSGESLYKRGKKVLTGHAPIRETFAASLIYQLINGISQTGTLIDPMTGSGTFLIEAATLHQKNNSRNYYYQYIPKYLEDKTIIALNEVNPLFSNKLKGCDIDPKICEMATKNIQELNLNSQINIENKDLFTLIEKEHFDLAIINPPYGIRVDSNREINAQFFNQIIETCFEIFTIQRLGIIVPADFNLNIKQKLISKIKFKNGGIPVIFYVFGNK